MSERNSKWPIVVWLLQLVLVSPILVFITASVYTRPTPLITTVAILAYLYVGLVLWVGITARGQQWIGAYRLQLLAFTVSGVTTFLICEACVTGAVLMGFRVPSFDDDAAIWIFEDSQETIHFDPVRGFRLTRVPARTARITHGTVEYVSEIRGNNQGFPDRDDFIAKRTESDSIRLAVFGDSFSAGSYLERNWPDYVEDQTRDSSKPVALLNFSTGGGGLANWWSVLTKIVENEGYVLDGVVFAVYGDDLKRRFCVSEHRGYDRHMFGRARTWDPRYFPKTDEEARRCLKKLNGFIVNKDKFDAALRGEWAPPKENRTLVPHLTRNLLYGFQKAWSEIPFESTEVSTNQLESDRIALIEDVRRSLRKIGLPVLVVFVPTKFELLQHGDELEVPQEIRQFADSINADLVNGGDAFHGMTKAEIESAWFPYDGHWAQSGSDRFGDFLVPRLQNWVIAR